MSNIEKEVPIVDIAADGYAIGKKNNIVIFMKKAVPGDIVDVEIFKKKKNYYLGRVIHIHNSNEYRVNSFCEHYGICGGCKWQHLSYQAQLLYKQKQINDAFNKISELTPKTIIPIIPSNNTIEYRNKMEYTFSCNAWLKELNANIDEKDKLALGFHVAGMYNKVVNINKCYLQHDFANQIRNYIRDQAIKHNLSFYDIKNHCGFLRNIIIRNTSINQWMLIVVFATDNKKLREAFLESIKNEFPQLTSIIYIINTKKNDSISDLKPEVYYGSPYIVEKMHNLLFKISPISFYQTNSLQAEKLYLLVKEFANLQGHELVYDFYTGTGTIANFIAKHAKRVIGVDNVELAIKDAFQNSADNNITNTFFIAGDLVKVFDEDFISKYSLPDVVITDPPRSGMHPKIINKLLEIKPRKIVYVSCNPATQARDIALLANDYIIDTSQAVDMFPHTAHVENVALLIKKH